MLTGLVAASLSASGRGARMVELAKRDIWSAARVAQERPDVAYSLLAVDFLPTRVLQRSLAAVATAVAAGRNSPLCTTSHSVGRTPAAFRQMMQVWVTGCHTSGLPLVA